MRKIYTLIIATFAWFSVQAQTAPGKAFPDSIVVKVHPSYDNVTGIHRWLFGENYRKEWAASVKLPVIHISQVYGGLHPLREGGGMQSKSLRLVDKRGDEWVIRSVEKTPDKLLPEDFRGTFAIDWLDDAMSGQHPFSALVMPPLAEAAHVRHANPVIGVLASDTALHEYNPKFTGLVVLLEEREPGGESDNTIKMLNNLKADHDVRYDGDAFLRARMLDLLVADWDRHEDQWRWISHKQNKEKIYEPVPRDRDQVFHVSQGVFPTLATLPWIDPLLDDFEGDIPRPQYSLFKTRFMRPYPDAQIGYEHWMQLANEFVKAETDEVLEAALRRLPPEVYKMRHDELIAKLKKRRDNVPVAMDEYYHFVNKNVDIRTSDKNELVTISDGPNNGMHVVITKLDKNGKPGVVIMDANYAPEITREVRLYISGGDDKVQVNTNTCDVKLRIVGEYGSKTYDVKQASNNIDVYSRKDSVQFTGDASRLNRHLSNDTSNTHFVRSNGYNVWMPLATGSINADDGFLLGLGFKYTGQDGFRKVPYTTVQQLMLTHAFATDAFRINYLGEWTQVIGKADFTLAAFIKAPNTANFFGRGNETTLNKDGDDYRRFYRTRFNTYEVDPALRWHLGVGNTISAGPSLQYYHMDESKNAGRLITFPNRINSYDSTTVNQNKTHLGVIVNFISNHRNSLVLPNKGYYFSVLLQGYEGLNDYAKSFAQIKPEFTIYQKLNSSGTFVLSDRVGGGVSIGKPAFYQSMFLGGQGNLLGYLQNRFAGQHMVYNNLQARLKLFKIASYIVPGELGIGGFYDVGRVWVNGESSNEWHQGTGGGLYFVPAGVTIIQVLAGHSKEGWYPYISFNFRI
ncbi:BamA/TamA family outer membrane protein [Mucilaginibacter agri]|uniref:BamA/TamA family outer membrane protein n=1 Tax=Mucilaginibacter agri TaxID=2695265 RepID=A0A965ZE42_9SPHI|nr:BamA/TamA family outer membrane protein [Mucilaginibacter agri]NCD69035.1 BamA/TamA family outer membrane protein [Mucilaginibacter agri]